MEYVTHQSRMLPVLAQVYAMHICTGNTKRLAYGEVGGPLLPDMAAGSRRVVLLSAALKAAATWYKTSGLQMCRECCGGQVCQPGFPLVVLRVGRHASMQPCIAVL